MNTVRTEDAPTYFVPNKDKDAVIKQALTILHAYANQHLSA